MIANLEAELGTFARNEWNATRTQRIEWRRI
jgi:hypothetical protein